MAAGTKTRITHTAVRLFARTGYEGMSMRDLVKESGVGLSSIYHFFSDKDEMLTSIFKSLKQQLTEDIEVLPKRKSAKEMLVDRIQFHFDNIDSVIFILKYYLHFRPQEIQINTGKKTIGGSLTHMEEVIRKGCETGEFSSPNIREDAKMITHLVNGFMLEYHPLNPLGDARKELVECLSEFIIRALEPGSGTAVRSKS